MNWFQKLLNNPNVHIGAALVSGAASVAFPQYAPALQVVAGALGASGIALPEQPKAASPAAPAPVAAPVINLPPAIAGGSYHKEDWINFAAALAAQFAKPEQGRS